MRLISILVLMLPLSSCALTPNTGKELAGSALPVTPDHWHTAHKDDVIVDGWLKKFGDPVLANLADEAIAHNRNIIAGAAAVDRARALARQARAPLFPSVGVSASASREGPVESGFDTRIFNLSTEVSWEADVWGRLRSGANAAELNFDAQRLDHQYARSSLVAAMARTYFTIKDLNFQSQISKDIVSSNKRILDIITLQFETGYVSQQDLRLAETELASAEANYAEVKRNVRDAKRTLEVLVGRYPAAEIELSSSASILPPIPPAGIPAQLLERRPDLLAAERQVASAFQLLQESRAARLPSFSLTSSIGGVSDELKSTLDPANLIWRLGTSLLAPIFQGGALQAAVEAADADQRAAIAAYGQKALDVFNEVESALDSNANIDQRAEAIDRAETAAQKAYDIAKLRFEYGDIDTLDLLQIQQRWFQLQSEKSSLSREQLEARVVLHLALGGNWK